MTNHFFLKNLFRIQNGKNCNPEKYQTWDYLVFRKKVKMINFPVSVMLVWNFPTRNEIFSNFFDSECKIIQIFSHHLTNFPTENGILISKSHLALPFSRPTSSRFS